MARNSNLNNNNIMYDKFTTGSEIIEAISSTIKEWTGS